MHQPLLDLADAAIVASFAAATLTLIVYVWRSERRPERRPSRAVR